MPMTLPHTHPLQKGMGLTTLGLALPLLWWVLQPGHQGAFETGQFLLWHSAFEVFSVVVSALVFVSAYRAILSVRKGAVVILGLLFLAVGIFDFLHLFSNAAASFGNSTNDTLRSVFLGLAARLMAALALLLYVALPFTSDLSPSQRRWSLAGLLACIGVLYFFVWNDPQQIAGWLITESGLTPLNRSLQVILIGVHVITLLVLWQRRVALAQECLMALVFAATLSGLSELFYSLTGAGERNGADVAGHVYKLAAGLYLFHATFTEALQRPLEHLQLQQLREKVALSAAPDGVIWVDQTGMILMANPAMECLSGYPPHELIGQHVNLFLPPHLREKHSQALQSYFTAPRSRAMGLLDLKLRRRDGYMLPVDISLGHFDDTQSTHAIAYIRDLTERKKFEESLHHQASHDELTGLPNRRLFYLQLQQAMAQAQHTGNPMAVLFLDLDDFKNVNDGFGHALGDALLLEVGRRMRTTLRSNDTLARMGGDEFAILLPNLIDVSDASHVAQKLLQTFQTAFGLLGVEVYSGASVGVAFYPQDAANSETLLRYADLAMYQAKAGGRGNYRLYSSEMDKRVHEDVYLHRRLKEALRNGHLQLHYQPQVDVLTNTIVGAEALLRWDDAELGMVSPARFIPVAEATGLILELSDWVLQTACLQIAAWSLAGTPLRVAVNVSAQQFRQHDLPSKVLAALSQSGAQARWLDIEITESAAMAQPLLAREQLEALVALGCRIALDDFGTGYSSLAYLKVLPVHKIKIDKSFIDGVIHSGNDATIPRAIIALAKNLGITAIAEGVETEGQRLFLQAHGCEHYQGWLFARAMPSEDLTRLLRQARQPASALLAS
jgi:diguanylate cyclase (GGDEF)-like protein/PAS domain S-box-containing protein